MTFIIYHFRTIDGGTYVGRTKDFSRRMREHKMIHNITDVNILGEYPNISVAGFGSLQPRLEYLWYMRLKPSLNKHAAGVRYYERDKMRHGDVDPFGIYEEFDERFCKHGD